MSVAIRLCKIGKSAKKRFCFRVVVIDKRKSRDGVFLEEIGSYDPTKDPIIFKIKKERLDYWVKHGAQVSDTVASLVKKGAKDAIAS
jgi:small subunit ribosomal protein S16